MSQGLLRDHSWSTAEARKLTWNMAVLQPQARERKTTSANHPISMLQLVGAYCKTLELSESKGLGLSWYFKKPSEGASTGS